MERIVVIGAAAGGAQALRSLLSALPPDFPAPLAVVLHVVPGTRGAPAHLWGVRGLLPVRAAKEGRRLEGSVVYLAAPDRHLLVDRSRLIVRRGARENGFRPSVDVLFRSAAHAWGSRAVGIVLSGALDDGASGLRAIKRIGGVAIVQDPADAAYGSMPMHALRRTAVDHVAAADAIGRLLQDIVRAPAPAEPPDAGEQRARLKLDLAGASGVSPWRTGITDRARSPYTCPECHGVMYQIGDGGARRFRCRTGHGYTAGTLLPRLGEASEDRLCDAVRTVEEAVTLMDETAQTLARAGDAEAARALRGKLDAAARRLELLRALALDGNRTDG